VDGQGLSIFYRLLSFCAEILGVIVAILVGEIKFIP
jgi:hypothetical protein